MLVPSHAVEDFLELCEGAFDFDCQQGTPGVDHPIILQLRTHHGRLTVAKCLTKQPLGTVSLDGVSDGFARGRNAESMMLQAVRTDESSHQRAVVTLTVSVNSAKFVRGTQM